MLYENIGIVHGSQRTLGTRLRYIYIKQTISRVAMSLYMSEKVHIVS